MRGREGVRGEGVSEGEWVKSVVMPTRFRRLLVQMHGIPQHITEQKFMHEALAAQIVSYGMNCLSSPTSTIKQHNIVCPINLVEGSGLRTHIKGGSMAM